MNWIQRTYEAPWMGYVRTYAPYFLGGLALAVVIDLLTRILF